MPGLPTGLGEWKRSGATVLAGFRLSPSCAYCRKMFEVTNRSAALSFSSSKMFVVYIHDRNILAASSTRANSFISRFRPFQYNQHGRILHLKTRRALLLSLSSCGRTATAMEAVRSAALAGPALPVGVIDWPGVASSLWRRHSVAWSPQLCQVCAVVLEFGQISFGRQ